MFQRITIIGNVGQDPEMRYTPDGIPVTSFGVATKETISKKNMDGGEKRCPEGWKESYNGRNWEVTTWFRVTCWRGLADTVNQWVKKGTQVFVEGTLKGDAANGRVEPRVWQEKQTGAYRASFEITARTVKFLGGRGESGGQSEEEDDTYQGTISPATDNDDSLPF